MTVAHPRQINGWHILAIFTAFFAVVIGADISFAVLAYRTAPGQAAKDPYEAGLLYQQHLDDRARERALGWRATVIHSDDGVRLTVADRNGSPVSGLAVNADFNRPATERGEVSARLTEAEPGLYRLTGRRWSGAWDMHATAVAADGRSLQIESRLQWP